MKSKELHAIIKEQKYEFKGKLMKRYEVVYNQKSLSNEQRKDLLRDLFTEMIHENYRDLESRINCYLQGTTHFKVEIQRPSA